MQKISFTKSTSFLLRYNFIFSRFGNCDRFKYFQQLAHSSYFKTGSGVSMEQSTSSICSSRTKKFLHACNKLAFMAQPIGPKSYRPVTPVKTWSHGQGEMGRARCVLSALNWCRTFKLNRLATLQEFSFFRHSTSINREGHIIEESLLQ